jgi:hypothetical protein
VVNGSSQRAIDRLADDEAACSDETCTLLPAREMRRRGDLIWTRRQQAEDVRNLVDSSLQLIEGT